MQRGWEGWRDDPKVDQVVVIMSGKSYVTISWKGFYTVFLVILTSTVELHSILFKRPPPLSFIQEDADKRDYYRKYRASHLLSTLDCFPSPSLLHDFVTQPKIHQAVIFNLSEKCGQRQPRQSTVYRSFYVSRFLGRYLTCEKKYYHPWTLGSHILQKQDF